MRENSIDATVACQRFEPAQFFLNDVENLIWFENFQELSNIIERFDILVLDLFDYSKISIDIENFSKVIVLDNFSKTVFSKNVISMNSLNIIGDETFSYRERVAAARNLIIEPKFKTNFRLRVGRPKSGLVFFGGTDNHNLTDLFIEKINDLELGNFTFNVLVGPGSDFQCPVNSKKITLHQNLSNEDLQKLFFTCDVAILSGGLTTFEAILQGLPVFIISGEPFECENGKFIEKLGVGKWLGHREVDEFALQYGLSGSISQVCKLKAAKKARANIGQGLHNLLSLIGEFC